MRWLYDILFAFFFCLSAPYYFWKMWRRGQWRENFGQRFGRFTCKTKMAVTNRHVVWLHAVSVGEVNLCVHLVRALSRRLPNVKIVASTTTSTGMGELRKKLPPEVEKIYYPIDFRPFVRRALGTVCPEAVILVEAEIWPNFLRACTDRKIPLFLVNARLSERSHRGYRRFGFLFRELFASFAGVGCQNRTDAERLRAVGCRPEAVHVVGNLKFDAAKHHGTRTLDVPALFRQLAVPPGSRIFVAGSTHSGEEALLADLFLRLKQRFPDLFFVLVPRHFERAKEVARDLAAHGVKFIRRTEMTAETRVEPGETDCLLVDTTGELRFFYEHADVIFVGKSLTAQGGQNPIEPGALGKAMVFGPNMQNFAPIAEAFLNEGGAVQVRDAAELEQTVAALLADEARRNELGRRALAVVQENLGAVDRTVDMIVRALENTELYIAPATAARSVSAQNAPPSSRP